MRPDRNRRVRSADPARPPRPCRSLAVAQQPQGQAQRRGDRVVEVVEDVSEGHADRLVGLVADAGQQEEILPSRISEAQANSTKCRSHSVSRSANGRRRSATPVRRTAVRTACRPPRRPGRRWPGSRGALLAAGEAQQAVEIAQLHAAPEGVAEELDGEADPPVLRRDENPAGGQDRGKRHGDHPDGLASEMVDQIAPGGATIIAPSGGKTMKINCVLKSLMRRSLST